MKNKVAAIILAAGKGTRMKSKDINKVTLPFLNKPLITYAVELMIDLSRPVIVVVGAFHKSVKKVLKKYPVVYAYQQKRLGTGHATRVGLDALKKTSPPPSLVLVGYGDHSMFYKKKSIEKLISLHLKNKAAMSLITTENNHPEKLRWGFIIRDEDGNLTDSVEYKDATERQRKTTELNAGFYCFDYGFLKANINKIRKSPESGEYYINSLIKIAVDGGKKVVGLKEPFSGVGIGINTYGELSESQKIFVKQNGHKK